MRDKKLLSLVEELAAFYRTELSPGTVLHFHMMALPPGKGSTNAEAMEDHAVEEVSDAAIADDLSVSLHELAHFLYHQSARLPFAAFARSPRLLRTMFMLGEETVSQAAMDELAAKVRPSNSSGGGLDETMRARWSSTPKTSGVVLVTTAHLARLRALTPLLGKASAAAIERAAPGRRALVYGVAKSPQTSIFVIVGADGDALKDAVDRLVALPRGRSGPLVMR